MIFTDSEYASYLAPLLPSEAPNRELAAATAAFSMLCEPGDGFAGLLCEQISTDRLLEALIHRLDAQDMVHVLGEDAISEVEEAFADDWFKLWGNALERWLPRLSKSALIESLGWMQQSAQVTKVAHSLLLASEDDFPNSIQDLARHRPFAFWCRGDAGLLRGQHLISVVGTRIPSDYGSSVTADIAAIAAQSGITTVSGGAHGIDAIVHQSALKLGAPTIAMMAGGLARLYPAANARLFEELGRAGNLLVSETAPDVTPAKWRFLMRNRLIAAAGNATVVVEAGKTSGALSTANHALSLDRPVVMVPGPITSSRSVGCHDYLNQNPGNVQLLARPSDIQALAGVAIETQVAIEGLGRLEKRALDAFGRRAIAAWEVQRLAGLTVRETQMALGGLEVAGLIRREGTSYRLVS